jgi:DNA-binding MarR family transcriptional regulator
MPRLDAERIALLRQLSHTTNSIERRIDADLMAEFAMPLAWFEVMSSLQRVDGPIRVSELCKMLDENPSSLSRRLDRLEDEGYIARGATPLPSDRRAVSVRLTREGRLFWRDANVIYRRAVQRHFAQVVTETDIAALQRVLSKLER